VADQKYWIFHASSIGMLKHYGRFFLWPLLIGVLFYFAKEFRQLSARYYAVLIGFVLVPMIYTCTFVQDQNIGFKNYYPIYIGLMTLALLFIRDFRSISQAFFTGVFVFLIGFPKAKDYFIKTLQKATDKMSKEDMLNTEADIILVSDHLFLDDFKEKYDLYSLPHSTRQYQRQQPPDNSIDRFFYEYTRKFPVGNFGHNKLLVWKYGNNHKDIVGILEKHGGKKEAW
jgi:hypothetical protein